MTRSARRPSGRERDDLGRRLIARLGAIGGSILMVAGILFGVLPPPTPPTPLLPDELARALAARGISVAEPSDREKRAVARKKIDQEALYKYARETLGIKDEGVRPAAATLLLVTLSNPESKTALTRQPAYLLDFNRADLQITLKEGVYSRVAFLFDALALNPIVALGITPYLAPTPGALAPPGSPAPSSAPPLSSPSPSQPAPASSAP